MAAILESRSAKGSSTNNISQEVGSSTETHVPYQSNKNVNDSVERSALFNIRRKALEHLMKFTQRSIPYRFGLAG